MPVTRTWAAANAAITSPLLETTIQGAKGVIINITSSPDITLEDVDTASSIIAEAADSDANIIFGVAFDEKLDDEMIVTVIATGFGTDVNGLANKAVDTAASSSDSSAYNGDDDDIGSILDLFKNK